MAVGMRANYVDRLLARVDGELAPIWISEIITTDEPPRAADLRAAVGRLVAEIERLRFAWDPQRSDWVPRSRRAEDIDGAVRELPEAPQREIIARLLREPVDLTRELPLRITIAPLADRGHDRARGRAIVAVQLHHAIGDARSQMHLNRRLWQILAGRPELESRLGPARMSDARFLAAAARRLGALPSILDPRHRVLARRGQALGRRGDTLGAPMLATLRVPLDASVRPEARSGLFFGALLAGMCAHDRDAVWSAPLRLRVPIDLRRELGVGATLENGCSAVPVEISGEVVRAALDEPAKLARLVPDELARLLRNGVHWGTLLECLAASRLASTATLRTHVRPDLVAPLRANTMVTTYVGSLDRYFADAPFPIRAVCTHTPTWGANGYSFGDALIINASAFEGLWSRADLEAFVGAMSGWLARHHGLACEVIA
jgi:hypothetical protein